MNDPEQASLSWPQTNTVDACLRHGSQRLALGKTPNSSRLDAELLLCHALGWTKTQLHTRITDPVTPAQLHDYWYLVKQRELGVPIAYLLGWKEFYSRHFWVRPGVLVPRPETELLVEQTLALLNHSPGPTQTLDLCCGTGCIGITLVLETLTGSVVCSDIDPEALSQARENARFYGVQDRLSLIESDLFENLSGLKFDLIVSNPPYIGTEFGPPPEPWVEEHEPHHALFSGPDGGNHLKQIVERAPEHLIEGGSLIVECAPFQAEKVEAWLEARGFTQTALWHDLSGLPRGVSGRWEGHSTNE